MPRPKGSIPERRYITGPRADGRYQVRVPVTNPLTGERRRHEAYAHTLTDARRLRDDILARDRLGVRQGRADARTVRDWLEEWFATIVAHQAAYTRLNRRSMLDRHILPALGNLRLAALTPAHVQRWVSDQQTAGAAPSTVRTRHACLHAGLEHAVRLDVLERNPARRVKLPAPEHPEQPSLTVEQARALLALAAGTQLEGMIAVGVGLGLRRGEMLGLRWQDVDLERGLLHVRVQNVAGPGGITTGEPVKTPGSRAPLPLPPPLARILAAHRERQRQVVVGPLVFCHDDGRHIAHATWYSWWRDIQMRAGMTPVGYHAARRACGSLLVAAGVDASSVRRIMRHTNAALTLALYARASQDQLTDAAERMGRVLDG